jgi:acetyl-CoA carboxylase carboxyl transferase subunit alpha
MDNFEDSIKAIETEIAELEKLNADPHVQFDDEISVMRQKLDKELNALYSRLTPWQTVQVARHRDRPVIRDYIRSMFADFIELHGDRCFGDDKSIIGGFATIGGIECMLLGHQKGRTIEENLESNFGMASPDGYRKAMRLMRLAEKYGLPVVTFIDTPGAYPGLDAEARGQAEAIARNITEMSALEVPILVLVTGEGGSGGALGIGVGDRVLMLQHSVYSVISPEGCASILWRDGSKAPLAAEAMKMTAPSLLELGIIDEIIPEPIGGAHRNPAATMKTISPVLVKHLKELSKVSMKRLLDQRFAKYARIGQYS